MAMIATFGGSPNNDTTTHTWSRLHTSDPAYDHDQVDGSMQFLDNGSFVQSKSLAKIKASIGNTFKTYSGKSTQ